MTLYKSTATRTSFSPQNSWVCSELPIVRSAYKRPPENSQVIIPNTSFNAPDIPVRATT
ncbi:uncharacterized protein RAG0_10608 [Rhynchosporium agropyri]|uniref:Uncharacterized protein n=2 Tax=Rhynchosporium TaxID=38037 RepID=A0A1E1MMS1_RHYSE|nr:uncharacterized protein RAG0_10608 [Rhynchosporium agropyri]CZT50391.1 uncharacterized protein RSE6_11366 [Rhynchosporium secalis]